MKNKVNNGFSLVEVLIAIGILAVGRLFVAGTFPVGIYFTAVASEKTTAAVVADEAFAKIQLYGFRFGSGPSSWPLLNPTLILSKLFYSNSFHKNYPLTHTIINYIYNLLLNYKYYLSYQ